MSSELIINASLPETRIALMENGEIQELLIERASEKGIVGNIYKGRVTRVLPGMQAAFVDIGLDKAAFLYVDDVYVHSKMWEEEEGPTVGHDRVLPGLEAAASSVAEQVPGSEVEGVLRAGVPAPRREEAELTGAHEARLAEEGEAAVQEASTHFHQEREETGLVHFHGQEAALESEEEGFDLDQELFEEEEDGDEEEDGIVEMGPEGGEEQDGGDGGAPAGVLLPESRAEFGADFVVKSPTELKKEDPQAASAGAEPVKRHRRGRRGGRFRKKLGSELGAEPGAEGSDHASEQAASGTEEGSEADQAAGVGGASSEKRAAAVTSSGVVVVKHAETKAYPESFHQQVADLGLSESDRSNMHEKAEGADPVVGEVVGGGRPKPVLLTVQERRSPPAAETGPEGRPEFKATRSRDRRIRPKLTSKPFRAQVNIQDLLKEGQDVLVQVAKDPISTKGARLTCHISLPGRHLVCMPTIDHVGVSRRIERDEERRRLREYVERYRPKKLGFIVRTASGRNQSEKRIKQDIDYLTHLWDEIREKASLGSAPCLVYEDLNAVLRSVRDWVTEEIDKVVVDSRAHHADIIKFVSHFMPPLKQKIELYQGDIPIFDAYSISTELSRALERKVWLKSGGYIVVDQAEALVAIDVNTGRYVGKKNLEDTILKTNLEAVQEIAYQLRLRNCGGIIILDLIDMEKEENKQRVYRALEEALSHDRARPSILKISELGLVEMTRKRTRDTIVRTLCESCTHCEGKGFIKSKQTVAYEALRELERVGLDRDTHKVLVQAHPDVIDILAIDERATLDLLEKKYRKVFYLQGVNDFHSEQFEVLAEKAERSQRGGVREPAERSAQSEGGRERNVGHERGRGRQRQEGGSGSKQHSSKHHHQGAAGSSSPRIPEPRVVPLPVPGSGSKAAVSASSESTRHDKSREEKAPGPHHAHGGHKVSAAGPTSTPATSSAHDEFYDEEDRLAFVRAQAAQDAALARLGNGHHTPPPALRQTPSGRERMSSSGSGGGGSSQNRGGGGGGGTGGNAGKRNHRGRRGGKFRRGPDQNRGHGGGAQGGDSEGNAGMSGASSSGSKSGSRAFSSHSAGPTHSASGSSYDEGS